MYFRAKVYTIWIHGPLGTGSTSSRRRIFVRRLSCGFVVRAKDMQHDMYVHVCIYVCTFLYGMQD